MSDFVQNLREIYRNPFYRDWILQSGILFIHYPLDYVRILSQIGYEPLTPMPGAKSKSLYIENVDIQTFYFPSMLTYLKYIKSVDGFWGLYRGFFPFFCANSVSYFVKSSVQKYSPENSLAIDLYSERINTEVDQAVRLVNTLAGGTRDEGDGDIPNDVDIQNIQHHGRVASEQVNFLWNTLWKVVSVNLGVVAAHPFYVIAVRRAAQFVGRETFYDSLGESIVEIFRNEGLGGFFKGLLPRLLGKTLDVTLNSLAIFVVKKVFDEDTKRQGFENLGVELLAGLASHLFVSNNAHLCLVVSNTLIVNNTRLAIGSTTYEPVYSSWSDAVSQLSNSGQIYRGKGNVYRGPFKLTNGSLIPTHHFGPLHPMGLGFKDNTA